MASISFIKILLFRFLEDLRRYVAVAIDFSLSSRRERISGRAKTHMEGLSLSLAPHIPILDSMERPVNGIRVQR
jgi:hypothetical protein